MVLRKLPLISAAFAFGLAVAACGGDTQPAQNGTPDVPGLGDFGSQDPDRPVEPGAAVTPAPSEQEQRERDELQTKLAEVQNLTTEEFLERYSVPFSTGVAYDPLTASGLTTIQASALALSPGERDALAGRGFVISGDRRFPTFTYGYAAIYQQDLPVFVSADSILWSIHESYDKILASLERGSLVLLLRDMLSSMRSALASGAGSSLGPQARADADLYLTIAESLLRGELLAPAANASAADIQAFYDSALSASGWKQAELFGVLRNFDFSQFQPRGHYKDDPTLEPYFRAMMWLGRIDFRLIETQSDHSQVFHRRQLEASILLRELMNDSSVDAWTKLDHAIGTFVGEPDNMTLPELDALLSDLGISGVDELANLDDATIAQAIISGGYGTQRISSHIMINGLSEGTMPLSSVFMLLGQRYVLDSHVFSNVVFDRVAGGSVYRMMPDPLDVGFAALANNHAGLLLSPELEQYGYAPDLASMRVLADAHPPEYWQANLYNLWLGMLRTLAPDPAVADPQSVGLPSVAGTEAWSRRLINTQLASWAELRHDTILYVKQSYTAGDACEFPDAYVEPNPQFFRKVGEYAARGKAVVAQLQTGPSFAQYFDHLANVAQLLEEMAEHQRAGAAHSQQHLDFINEAVVVEEVCGGAYGSGWYPKLFFGSTGVEYDPVIADVHTQPTEPGGAPVGRVLHVGTAGPRLMVMTAETCSGPRAYAGLVSSYYEVLTENFDRLDDDRWESQVETSEPPGPEWMTDLVVQ